MPLAPSPSDDVNPFDDILRSTHYGVFRIIALDIGQKNAGVYGAFEVRCPFHKLNDKGTGCAKYVRIEGSSWADRFYACRRAVFFCQKYHLHTRQRDHVLFGLDGDLPDAATLRSIKPPYRRPKRGSVKDDDWLDRYGKDNGHPLADVGLAFPGAWDELDVPAAVPAAGRARKRKAPKALAKSGP